MSPDMLLTLSVNRQQIDLQFTLVLTSLALPDPWIRSRALIKGLVTLACVSCAVYHYRANQIEAFYFMTYSVVLRTNQ